MDAKYPMTRIRKEIMNKEAQEAELAEIRRVIGYCMNDVDCRRAQVLGFFGEKFDPAKCGGTCDNCANHSEVVNQDLSTEAANMVQLIEELDGNATRVQLIEVFIDKKNNKFPDQPHSGSGRDVPQNLAERLFDHLVYLGVVSFEEKQNSGGWRNSYAKLVGTSQPCLRLNGVIDDLFPFPR